MEVTSVEGKLWLYYTFFCSSFRLFLTFFSFMVLLSETQVIDPSVATTSFVDITQLELEIA